MKRKIFLFNVTLLIYIANLTISDGQVSSDNLPAGAIARLSPGAAVYTVAFSPDGKFLASGGDDNTVILWDVADENEYEAFIQHNKAVASVAFSPDGKLLASASLDGYVRLWYVSSEGRRISLRHGGWVESVAFSPDGKTLVSGGEDQEGSVILWDVHQRRDIATFSGHGGLVESVAFSPDGRMLASGARDNTIKLWDIEGERIRNTLSEHSSVVHAVAFSPNGETLASSSRDNTIKLWQVSSGENLATFKIQNNLYVYAESIAFSPDGRLLAAACVDYTVKLWDVVNHREVATLAGHYGGLTSVAFSPDGRTLASGSRDRTVLLWDLSYFGFEAPPINDRPNPPDFSDHQDNTPPDIVIQSPTEHIVAETVRQVPIRASTIDDSGIAEVWINGREASVSEGGVFSGTVPLNHGENIIRIIATDTHGNTGTHQFTIVREKPDRNDPTPPEIVIHSPTSHSVQVTTEQFTIEGSVIDDRGIAEVWINDVKVVVSDVGEFTATILLDFGDNDIHVTATDTQGNIDTNVLIIHREDTEGPEIQIDSPEYSERRGFQPTINSSAEPIRVSGRVTDPSGVAEIKVNGIGVEVREDKFETAVSLTAGNNLIRVTATDTWGNQSVKEITVQPPPLTRKDYALLFAVDTYDHWPRLRYPRVDAINIKQDLEQIYGFQVELIKNPTETEVFEVLDRYAQKEYAPEDQLLIFFAGHGYFNEGFKIGYLVAQDTQRPNDNGTLLSYLSHSHFRDIIDRMACEHIFLIMDTCYSGTFDERLAMRGEAENLSEMLSSEDIKRTE
jgi:WD40 repeat protein